MQHIIGGYRSLGLILNLNWDRILVVFVMLAALFAGAFIGSLLD